jgi:hypothetical protein
VRWLGTLGLARRASILNLSVSSSSSRSPTSPSPPPPPQGPWRDFSTFPLSRPGGRQCRGSASCGRASCGRCRASSPRLRRLRLPVDFAATTTTTAMTMERAAERTIPASAGVSGRASSTLADASRFGRSLMPVWVRFLKPAHIICGFCARFVFGGAELPESSILVGSPFALYPSTLREHACACSDMYVFHCSVSFDAGAV